MAIQKRFIHFKKFSDFNSKKLSANEANTQHTVGISGAIQDGEPDILYQSYVWIKDTKQQWTHGQLYDGSSDTYTTEFTVSDLFSISEDSPLTINKEALVNAVLLDKIIIIPYQDNKGCYVVSIDAFDEKIYFNIHIFASVVSFVIYPNEPTNEITVEDIFMTDFQEALISGENIRTINGEDIIGDGSDLELATKDELNGKQNTITDLETIRSGAALGATALQEHQDISHLASKDELHNLQNEVIADEEVTAVAINDLNTRLNKSILDIDELTASGMKSIMVNGVNKFPSSGVVDLGYINKQLSTSTSSSMTLSPNIYYRNTSTSLSTLTITLGSVSNSNIINEYFVEFTTSSSGTTVSLPSTIKWANGEIPTFEARTTYQISIVNNLGVVTKFE